MYEDSFDLSWQEVAFLKECRKNQGLRSLKEDFHIKFEFQNKGFGAVTWLNY